MGGFDPDTGRSTPSKSDQSIEHHRKSTPERTHMEISSGEHKRSPRKDGKGVTIYGKENSKEQKGVSNLQPWVYSTLGDAH